MLINYWFNNVNEIKSFLTEKDEYQLKPVQFSQSMKLLKLISRMSYQHREKITSKRAKKQGLYFVYERIFFQRSTWSIF